MPESTPQTWSVDRYRAHLLALAEPLPTESVPLAEASGRVSAGVLTAGRAVPAADQSAMDGFAVRWRDVVGATAESPARLRLVGESAAGSPLGATVTEGTAAAVMTGAVLPPGAELVVRVEQSLQGGFGAEVPSGFVELWPETRSNVRAAGSEARLDEPVLAAGRAIGPLALAVLAASGHRAVDVVLRPRVALVSTGNELVAADGAVTALDPGQVLESNGPMLAAAVVESGAEVHSRAVAGDERGELIAALDRAAASGAHLIVTTGGVSAGRHDLMHRLDDGPDSRIDSFRVRMKPGRPQASGRWRGVPVICLPGNPVAAFVSFLALVRPVIHRLGGLEMRPEEPGFTVVTAAGWSSPVDRTEFAPLRRTGAGWVRCERRWASLAQAEAVAVVPPGVDQVVAGSSVAVLSIASAAPAG